MQRNSIPHSLSEYESIISKQSFPIWIDAEDMLDIIEYYERAHKEFEAEYAMRVALKMHPDNQQIKYHQACRLKIYGKWSEAFSIVRGLENQEDLDVLFFYAEKALSELKDELASQYIARIITIAGTTFDEPAKNDEVWLDIGNLCLDYGFSDLALEYYSKVAETSPEYIKTALSLAEVYFQKGDTTEAERIINKVLDLDPYNIEAWVLMADIAYESKNFDLCIEASDFALAINKEHQRALRFRTFAALEKKDYDTVLDIYKSYAKYYPDDYCIAISVGEIYIKRNQYKLGIDILAQANRCCPNDNPDKIRILTDIATAYSELGDMPKAHNILLGACSLGSKHSDVILQTLSLAIEIKDYNYCDKLATEYIKEHPQISTDFIHQLAILIDSSSAWHFLPDTTLEIRKRLHEI